MQADLRFKSYLDQSLLNRDASPELANLAQHIEDQSDKWSDNLALSDFPHDAAVWGVLTQLIGLIEGAAEKHGFASQRPGAPGSRPLFGR